MTQTLLSPAAHARLITVALRWMKATVWIVTTPMTDDGRGGKLPGTDTHIAVQANINLAGASATEQAIADRAGGRTLWTINVPLGTAVNAATDRVFEPSTGRSFEILAPLPATDAVTLALACVESSAPGAVIDTSLTDDGWHL